jgi:hypothetical protein
VKKAIRRAGRAVTLSLGLYRELTLSALTLIPSRR